MPVSRPDLPAGHLQEMARVERLLRDDERAEDPVARVGQQGAKVSWESWELNEHARGSLTATVANEIAATEAWGLSTIHDPVERDGRVTSMLSVVYVEADRDG